ncbi:MAG TPA: S41 family peptidase [Bdellovibrio sp.]|uniref:S41 family peptidase n=1 Tax=Bdellovibrio sp. TaxID=28201 RepID=UPI002F061BF2
MKKTILVLSLLTQANSSFAAQFEGNIPEWKSEKESFKKSEESFKKALQILKDKYADKNVTEEDLYRAATEGMLAALNSGKENWNTLLTPRNIQDTNIEISGQLVGIGATMDFDTNTKNARIRGVIQGSAAEKAGLRRYDQILSVNGKRYKDLQSMVLDIRGKAGESVKLKILREDHIIDLKVTRSEIKIPLVVTANIDSQTGYLQISGFTNETPIDLKTQLNTFKNKTLTKLIIDLRSNHGGVFEKAIEAADIFLKKNDVIVKAKSREGSIKEFKSKGSAWSPETKLIVLTDSETSSSAEVLAATLKENRHAILMGDKTAGKWTVESLERLPNDYYIKYSVMSLLSPSDKSYEGVGLKPDFEIGKPTETDFIGYDFIKDIKTRMEKDPTLKAAVELPAR